MKHIITAFFSLAIFAAAQTGHTNANLDGLNAAAAKANLNGIGVFSDTNAPDKTDVGLGNVDNTSDANKPIGTATQIALNGKATSAQGTKADIAALSSIAPAADSAGAPAFAFALQRVVSTYIGACVKVRRSSDNAEADIGFTPTGELDTVSLLEFCGSGNGLIKTWYDQSGNGRNLTQATTTKQPTLVSSGALVTLNGQPAASFSSAASQNMQASAFSLSGATAGTFAVAFSPTSASATSCVFDHGRPYFSGGFGINLNQFGVGRIELVMGSASAATRLINYTTGYTANSTACISGVIEPGAATNDLRGKMRWNGAEVNEAQTGTVSTLSTGVFLSDVITVGSDKVPAAFFDGKITALMCWASKLSGSAISAMETQALRSCGLATPYMAIPSTFDETGTVTQDADFMRTSAFANTTWITRATVLKIHHVNDIYSSYPQYADLVINVDGAFYQQVLASADGFATSTVFLPAGLKTVEIVSGLQSRPGAVGSTVFGMFPISIASNAPMDRVTVSQSNRLVIYGDSISVGGNSTIAARDGWSMKVRSSASYPVGVEGFGFRALHDDCSDSTARAAFVAKIVAWNPAKLWICIGSNDYGLNRWSAASFGTAYAALLDDLHAALPSMAIYCQTPLLRATETANGSGSTLGNYRTQIATAVSTRSAWATLVDGTAIMTTGSLGDGVHPTDAGHVLYANFVKTVLGIQ